MEGEQTFSTRRCSLSMDEFGYHSGDNGSFSRRSSDESDTTLPQLPSINLSQARTIIDNYGRQLQKCIKNVGVDPANAHAGERLGVWFFFPSLIVMPFTCHLLQPPGFRCLDQSPPCILIVLIQEQLKFKKASKQYQKKKIFEVL